MSTKARNIIKRIYRLNSESSLGFRRQNMASLLYRYFNDLTKVLANLDCLLKNNAAAFIVIRDNYTIAGQQDIVIETTDIIHETTDKLGWKLEDIIPISVTTEAIRHVRNSIREKSILYFKKIF